MPSSGSFMVKGILFIYSSSEANASSPRCICAKQNLQAIAGFRRELLRNVRRVPNAFLPWFRWYGQPAVNQR